MACALWGKNVSCFYCWILAKTDKYSAVKHCPSPFSDHVPIIPWPLCPLPPRSSPSSIPCQEGQPPKSHFNSARHRQRLVDPAASKVSVSCRMVHGGVVPLRRMGWWGITYACILEGLRGGKVFSVNSRPLVAREFLCWTTRLGNKQNPDQ